jgi:demethylmenaquinone methyltransferase/2-methoxy-6-polyprenyl-1,4-benzoquinol methylase
LPEAYVAMAQDYQRRSSLFPGWRELLVRRLDLRPGATVLDIGAGPGVNFAALHDAVGTDGTIIAVEESPQLLAVAARQVACRGWDNIELINARVENVTLSVLADAALFAAVPDVLSSPAAVTNIVDQLRPGAAVAAGGWQKPPGWLWPLRTCVTAWYGRYVSDLDALDQPWRHLAARVAHLHVSNVGFGAGYLAHTIPDRPPRHAPPRRQRVDA